MSKQKLITTIHAELEKINEQIDLKIIQGQDYKKESKRHKFLISHLTQAIRGEEFRPSWTYKISHIMASFLL
ncbi:MAG: hypothetical protein V4576_01185 [Patescibacteria group bacterium]|jgi:hypothetical protein